MAKSKYPLLPISELAKPTERRFVAKDWWDEPNDYIETNGVDLIEGTIMSSTEITGKTAPNRARILLDTGDFLIPNARDCVRGVAIVPERRQGWVCSNRFFVVKPDKSKVEPLYLYHVLRQVEVLALLKRQATGEINPGLGIEALSKVFVPVPEQKDTQLRIVEQIRHREQEKQRLLEEARKQEEGISVLVREGVPSSKIDRERFDKLGYDYVNEI